MGAKIVVPTVTELAIEPLQIAVDRNTILLYEHKDFKSTGRHRRINVTESSPSNMISLHAMDFKDCLSSLRWNLDSGVVVTFYEHETGGGRSYQIYDAGEDNNTHNNNFKDCASAWSWHRTS